MQLTTDRNLFFAKFAIFGRTRGESNAIVDTGASETLVDEEIIINAGLTPNGFRDKLVASGVRVPFSAWIGRIEIDNYSKNDVEIFGLPPVILNGMKVEGLLGRDIMKNGKLIIDWQSNNGELIIS
jgi:predicted aspartyl protease